MVHATSLNKACIHILAWSISQATLHCKDVIITQKQVPPFLSGNANLEPLVIISSSVVESCCQYVPPWLDTLWKLISIRHCLIRTPSAWGYSHKQPNWWVNAVNELLFVFFIRKTEHWVCLFMPGAVQVMLQCLYLDKNCCSVSLWFISGFITTTAKQQHFMVVAMEVNSETHL